METLTAGAVSDEEAAHQKAHLLLMELAPALERDDWPVVCQTVNKLQLIGSKVSLLGPICY